MSATRARPPAPLEALRALERHFGYPGFRPGQGELVGAVLEGRDAVGILPTGGGKSVCYQVPAALLPGLTLVVSPLLSLMADQVARCLEAGIPAAYLGSSLGRARRREVRDRVRGGAVRILFVAPERFSSPGFQELMDGVKVALLAVDEAHCISMWGNDFRPAYKALGEVRVALGAPTLALTATATPRVRDEIVSVLGLERPRVVVRSFDRPNLAWRVRSVADRAEKRRRLFRLLWRLDGSAVVYAGTRRSVEAVRDTLAARGLAVEAYHAGLPPEERARVQDAFMSGSARVVVATNAFGMGIDKPDVRRVVHWELPGTLEDYYQEAGRAGRDGHPAECVALRARGDLDLRRGFLDRTHPPPARVREAWRLLRRRIDPGQRGTVKAGDLARAFRTPASPEEVASCLRILSDAGGVRLMSPLPEAAEEEVAVGVHRGRVSMRAARARRAAELWKLAQVAAYARERGCRRAFLLGYFGETVDSVPCGRCDGCVGR